MFFTDAGSACPSHSRSDGMRSSKHKLEVKGRNNIAIGGGCYPSTYNRMSVEHKDKKINK